MIYVENSDYHLYCCLEMGWKNSVNSDLGQKRAVLDFGLHGQLQAQSVTLLQELVQIQMHVCAKYKNKIMAINRMQNWVQIGQLAMIDIRALKFQNVTPDRW